MLHFELLQRRGNSIELLQEWQKEWNEEDTYLIQLNTVNESPLKNRCGW